jgi:penicillin G amidase
MTRFARRPHSPWTYLTLLILTLALHLATDASALANPFQALPGLEHPARVIWDSDGIPHVYATTDRDAILLQGYIHAQDRMYWMDSFRHIFDGTLAELVGEAALASDLQFRKFNLQAASQKSFDAMSGKTQSQLRAYAAGVNAYLATNPTPQEYGLLELDTVRPWLPTDSILMLKGLTALAWAELGDIKRTVDLADFNALGASKGFDGNALFFEDVYRVAPVVPAVVLPGFLESIGGTEAVTAPLAAPTKSRAVGRQFGSADIAALDPQVLQLARDYWQEVSNSPVLEDARRHIQEGLGSNWWLIGGALSETGRPLLASDPHNPVTMPTALHPIHLVSRQPGGLQVNGTNFGGIPGVLIGCNTNACWAGTNSNIDGGDVFQEELLFDPATGVPTHTVFRGVPEPIVRLPQQYRFNNLGDGIVGNLSDAPVAPLVGDLFLIPRRADGPLLSFTQTTGSGGVGLSSQYVGWAAGRDAEAILRLGSVRNVDDFLEAVALLDNFNLHMGYADREGHIAYAVGGDVPLREDLQLTGEVDGQPPTMIRDGSGVRAHQWLAASREGSPVPYSILPQAEMPQAVDPPEGFIVTANNDPIGGTVDNDLFDQFRPDGGVLYFHYSYRSLRAARIQSEIARLTANGGKLSMAELKAMQANNQLMDAEVILPSLLEAYANAQASGAPAALATLAADPRIEEAIGRLVRWDYSTPTGIEQGYDPGDDPNNLQAPGEEEIANSVAATLYSVWRGQAVRRVVDETLVRIGLGDALPDSETAFRAFANQVLTFDATHGGGASGVDCFAVDGVSDRQVARDIVLLESLQATLDLLASDAFAPAFGHSTHQNDYRWGRLHRITIAHVLSPAFSVPNAGGFQDLEPTLTGLARGGGLETVDAASHDARAADANSFKFAVTPGYRMVVELTRRGPKGEHISPGGAGGDPFDARYTNQMGRWLTHQYAPMRRSPGEVNRDAESRQTFVPQR